MGEKERIPNDGLACAVVIVVPYILLSMQIKDSHMVWENRNPITNFHEGTFTFTICQGYFLFYLYPYIL